MLLNENMDILIDGQIIKLIYEYSIKHIFV